MKPVALEAYQWPPSTEVIARRVGLDPRATYRVRVYGQQDTQELSGAYLMENGVTVQLRGDYDSTSVLMERM